MSLYFLFTCREVTQFFWLSDFGGERQHASPESDLSLCRSPHLILVGTETRRLVFISFAFPSLELFPLLCDYIYSSYSSQFSEEVLHQAFGHYDWNIYEEKPFDSIDISKNHLVNNLRDIHLGERLFHTCIRFNYVSHWIYKSIYLSIKVLIYVCIYECIYVCRSRYLTIYLSTYPSIYSSIYLVFLYASYKII